MDTGLSLIRAETAAARIEGLLLADPDLARAWRTQAAFVEAAATVGLEDVRIPEAAVIMRLTMGEAADLDARGTETASRVVGILKRPPPIFADPVGGLRRLERAAMPLGKPAELSDRLEDAEIEGLVARARGFPDTPILAGLRAAAEYAHRSRRSTPLVERLLFTCVEGEARAERSIALQSRRSKPAVTASEEPQDAEGQELERLLFQPAMAGWTALPATALSRDGFRLWSPISGAGALLAALADHAVRELGAIGQLRHELARLARAGASAHGRSRLPQLAGLLRERLVLTSALVVEILGVSRKTALALIATLAAEGLIVEITARRAARIWALPSLGARLRQRPRARMATHMPYAAAREHSPQVEADSGLCQQRIRETFDEARLARIMAELDAALENADRAIGTSAAARMARRTRDGAEEDASNRQGG